MVTPFVNLYGEHPDYNSLKVFWCRRFPYIKNSNKFSPKTYHCVFIGYNNLHKGCRCYHPSIRRVYISIDVVFDENTLPYVSSSHSQTNIGVSPHLDSFVESFYKLLALENHNLGEVQVDSTQVTGENATTTTPILIDDECAINPSGDPDDHEEQIESDDPTVVMRQIDENPAAHFELPSGSEEQWNLPEHHQPENTIPKSTTSVDVLPASQGNHIISRHTAKEHHLSLVACSIKEILREPNTTKAALRSPHWLAAMQEEINALHTNKAWILVPKSPGVNLVGSKWLFNTKLKDDGTVQG
ncbi:hypothetical protein KY290_035198 [Solanum tuberosum]|uniref:Retroviral polymerase SH3-like domain-containing protein n=1 Tax=Solanum tuberosum TaxID=4113 RepID=A0ABQ7U5Q6_SOLTU|nr:hypothetical protein KY289_032875 [Solanum tuberosum]KAH0647522.1 hypothetical protein KY285_032770 [Solanum tuberosum]KAH0742155.1 hypothetical protein KY290_035198 [Solanum tuberosum]